MNLTEKYPNLTVADDNVVRYLLTLIRDKETDQLFRFRMRALGRMLIERALNTFSFFEEEVETPMGACPGTWLDSKIAVFCVLRAALAFDEAFTDLAIELDLDISTTHLGLVRDSKAQAQWYEKGKYPDDIREREPLIIDPMQATAGTLIMAIGKAVEMTGRMPRIICAVSAPEGVEAVFEEFPEVRIWTAGMGEGLDDRKYIRNDLGDAGDRSARTKKKKK